MTFKELGLGPVILKALAAQGYSTPTPIQVGAIPPALIGRDVLGIAQTGTGKTCAFATPILQRLTTGPQKRPRVIRSLILTPTRELALQIQESFEAYGAGLPLRSAVIFGGVGQQPQVDKIKAGLDILVATPGRLLDLHGQGFIDLSHIEIFVLDEADRMLDMGFIHDVRKVLKLLPDKKQTLFFSATMPPEVTELVNGLLHNYAKVAVTPVSSPVEVIRQSLYYVDKGNKTKLLAHLLQELNVKNALVFSRTKHGANRVAQDLAKHGVTAAAIHGNKSQTARVQALTDFKKGRLQVLVATDIAARGLDIEELSHVFNYNLPDVPETYVHRIGRTGRAGRGGVAVSFCDIGEKDDLKGIEKLLGKPIPVVEDHPWPMEDFSPPKRDKHGKIINAEDDEARQAARERKKERMAEKAAAQAAGKPQEKPAMPQPGKPVQAQSGKSAQSQPVKPAQSQPGKPVQSQGKLKPAQDKRTPGEKRQAAGYKASRTVDDALHAMAPKSQEKVQPQKSERDLAFEKWMAEERAIQAKRGWDPLAGDTVMDATARLLAPKNPAVPPQRPAEKRREEPRQPQPARQQPKTQPKQQPKPAKAAAAKPAQVAKPAAAKPVKPAQAAKPVKPVQPVRPVKPVQPTKPAKPAQADGAALSLEERKAKIRAQAKARAAQRAKDAQRPRTSGELDSTEHHSLMKPYYLNED